MPARVRVKVEGLDALSKKLNDTSLIREPAMRMLEDAARTVESVLKLRVPTGATGQLRASITHRLDRGRQPYAAVVTASAVARSNGFRYGYALDASARYHYRGRRKQTRKWFSNALASVRSRASSALKKAEQEITQRWQR